MMRPRPEPGTVKTFTRRTTVCGECGYVVETGMCSDDCPQDLQLDRTKDFEAVYEITEKFLGDEPIPAKKEDSDAPQD